MHVPRTQSGGFIGCGSWLEARGERARLGTRPVLQESLYSQWVSGFLSGVAWQKNLNDRSDLLGGYDNEGLMTWLDNYCRANPLEPFARAVFELVHHLESRRR